jgi:pentatricopeptide repeat protein
MDLLRVILVPFHVTSLMLIAVFAVLLSIFDLGGLYGIFASIITQIWVVKYCYVLVEHIADGAHEPPVMSTDMLSPFELRPWVQTAIIVAAGVLCVKIGGGAGLVLGCILLALLPASIAVLGVGEPYYQAINPVMLLRLVRGLGPYYPVILVSIPLYLGLLQLLRSLDVWNLLYHAVALACEISFFALIGGCMYIRRHQLGIEPSRSPERTEARAEAERVKLRARMLDDMFQQARIGKFVDATRPLAKWLGSLDGDTLARDAPFIASQALGWQMPAGLNTIGSTLIRHLLRAGRPEVALAVFERLRERAPTLTLDSPDDLRTLIDFAEDAGKSELATSMRLETPIFRPRSTP